MSNDDDEKERTILKKERKNEKKDEKRYTKLTWKEVEEALYKKRQRHPVVATVPTNWYSGLEW